MSDRKRSWFIFTILFAEGVCLYYATASLTMIMDIIFAIRDNTNVTIVCSSWFYCFGSSTIILQLFIIVLSIIVSASMLLFYRKELSKKVLGLLCALPIVIVFWLILFALPSLLYGYYSIDVSNNACMLINFCSLSVAAIYGILTLRAVLRERKPD